MQSPTADPHPLQLRWREPPSPGASLDIVPGLKWLRMPLPFALDHVNTWLLAEQASWTAVDCGYGDAATRGLWERHFDATLAGRPLGRVIATHHHPDHIGNAAWLGARWGCAIVMPRSEYLTAHAVAEEHSGHGVAPTLALFRMHGLAGEALAAVEARGNVYRRGVPELPLGYQPLAADEEVRIGPQHWRVIPGHGHSPEHAALHAPQLKLLIAGDMLLPTISTNVSVVPAEPDADPLRRFLASLERFAALPPDTLVLPSHGLPFVGIHARVEQLRAHHRARLAELEAAAGQPVTAAQMLPLLFRRELDSQQLFFAMGEAIAHLNYLWHAGRLLRSSHDGILRFGRR